jgi:hypothetical protein
MENNNDVVDDDKKRKRDDDEKDDMNPFLTEVKRSEKNDGQDRAHWLSNGEAEYSDWSLVVKEFANVESSVSISISNNNGNDKSSSNNVTSTQEGDVRPNNGTTSATTTTSSGHGMTEKVITYSVHKSMLGPKSVYFKNSFSKKNGLKESRENSGTIELPSPNIITIQHFETLLDYFYTESLKLENSNAVAIVYFGDYFGIEKLLERAQDFIRMSIQTAKSKELAAYYQDAKLLVMEDLQHCVELVCAGRPEVMKKNTALSMMPDISFWCSVWAARKKLPDQTLSDTIDWSENLADFIEHHRDIVDIETFKTLTHIDSLPVISPDAAVTLMEKEQELCPGEDHNKNTLSCLQKRCTEALFDRDTGIWQVSKRDSDSLQELQKRLKQLPPTVFLSLVERAMEYKGTLTSIEVSGAENNSANGNYIRSGIYQEKPMFVRRALHAYAHKNFIIYLNGSEFCIGIFKNDGTPLSSSPDHNLYYRDNGVDQPSLPPKNGWSDVAFGESSNITLRFIYNE